MHMHDKPTYTHVRAHAHHATRQARRARLRSHSSLPARSRSCVLGSKRCRYMQAPVCVCKYICMESLCVGECEFVRACVCVRCVNTHTHTHTHTYIHTYILPHAFPVFIVLYQLLFRSFVLQKDDTNRHLSGVTHQKLRVCEVCSAHLSVYDNDRR